MVLLLSSLSKLSGSSCHGGELDDHIHAILRDGTDDVAIAEVLLLEAARRQRPHQEHLSVAAVGGASFHHLAAIEHSPPRLEPR